MTDSDWIAAPFWKDWLALTRLQWGARIAFDTECERWGDRTKIGKSAQKVTAECHGGTYETSLANHIAAISDPHLLWSLILLKSYALLESHAKLTRHMIDTSQWDLFTRDLGDHDMDTIDAIRLQGGIESWGTTLLRDVGQSWDMVYGAQTGLVEISLMRNALMHGYRRTSQHLVDSFAKRGCVCPKPLGAPVQVDFGELHEYRGRIRSFCRIISDGVVHTHRGTIR